MPFGAAWTNRDSFLARVSLWGGRNADIRKVARASLSKTVEWPVRNCEEEKSIKDILHVHSVAHSGAPPHPPFSVSTIGGGWVATVQTAFLGKTDTFVEGNPAPASRTRSGRVPNSTPRRNAGSSTPPWISTFRHVHPQAWLSTFRHSGKCAALHPPPDTQEWIPSQDAKVAAVFRQAFLSGPRKNKPLLATLPTEYTDVTMRLDD